MESVPRYRKFTILGILVFLGGAFIGDHGLLTLYKQRRFIRSLEAKNIETLERNRTLQLEIQYLKDPVHLKKIIRDELNRIEKDELVFVFPAKGSS
ncbi:MAG: septum formation initiator family protein [bacterium]|nr:septum formation initiator family protein [bacterium]